MLSVVIIEDETLILKELLLTIPWKELELSVAGTAENGLDGERIIRSTDPDIVITDIRLPGKNGLEMLEDTAVEHGIILSGYTDYSYMRKAIRLGVFDYLQKPIETDELISALERLRDEIKAEAKNEIIKEDHDLIVLPERISNHSVRLAVNYIKEHYNESIGLHDIAEITNISENYLSTLFREETGMNFLQYLNAIRINKAVELLKNSSLNISEIAETTGFPTPGYFTKIFRRFFSVTPTEYRCNM